MKHLFNIVEDCYLFTIAYHFEYNDLEQRLINWDEKFSIYLTINIYLKVLEKIY